MLPFLMIPAWDLRDRPGGGGSNRQCHRWHSLVVEGGEGGGGGLPDDLASASASCICTRDLFRLGPTQTGAGRLAQESCQGIPWMHRWRLARGTGSRTTRGGGAWWRCRSGDGVGFASLRLFAFASARLVRCSRARMATAGCIVLESTRTTDGAKEKGAFCGVGLGRPVWCLDFIVSSFSVRLVRLDGEVLGVWGAVDVRSRRPKNPGSHQSDKAGGRE